MQNMRLILASTSPRRRDILQSIGLQFETTPSGVDETVDDSVTPEDTVKLLSERKARSVADLYDSGLIIGSDTLVVSAGKKLGKPDSDQKAIATLRALRGMTHQVMTGLTLIEASSGRILTEVVVTNVTMRNYSEEEISSYVATGEPHDKAGSYAIQGLGAKLVASIDGPLDNVVGLPSAALIEMLGEFGLKVSPPTTTSANHHIEGRSAPSAQESDS